MSKVRGRRDDMLIVRGVNVYPSEVEAVLMTAPVTPHYLLVVDERGPVTELVVCCESATTSVEPAVAEALHHRLGLRAQVRVLPPGTVPRQEVGKAVRVARWRGGDPPVAGL